jgi:uncharacterized protein DUF3846
MLTLKALVIPAEGPLFEIEIAAEGNLKQFQDLVGGYIEAVPLPGFIRDSYHATAYVNEEGKYLPTCAPNMRATDFMVPGVGLMPGDYIAGTFVLCGFDPNRGEHRELPNAIVRRARKIEREAG